MSKKNPLIKAPSITTLFLDIGGVLLSNGWDHSSRTLAAEEFKLNFSEMEERHHLTFDIYESGKIDMKEYLRRVVFYQKRSFTQAQFTQFMYAQTKPYPEMLELMRRLKTKYGLKIGVVSNEARELNAYRIKKFKLENFVDFFVSSCFVHLRKPDGDIFRMALDIAQTPSNQVVYIEDRKMFVTVAEGFGINGLHHTDYQSTYEKLINFGLKGL